MFDFAYWKLCLENCFRHNLVFVIVIFLFVWDITLWDKETVEWTHDSFQLVRDSLLDQCRLGCPRFDPRPKHKLVIDTFHLVLLRFTPLLWLLVLRTGDQNCLDRTNKVRMARYLKIYFIHVIFSHILKDS